MEKAADGLFVSVDYTGTFEDGEVFDSSKGRRPLEVHMGAGQMIAGFEKALQGMALNEKKSFTLSPEEAYGERDESLTREFPAKDVPEGMNPQAGQTVALNTSDGRQIPAQITEVSEESITLDLNHPMAGKTLNFEVQVVNISDTPTQADACSGCGDAGGCSGCGD